MLRLLFKGRRLLRLYLHRLLLLTLLFSGSTGNHGCLGHGCGVEHLRGVHRAKSRRWLRFSFLGEEFVAETHLARSFLKLGNCCASLQELLCQFHVSDQRRLILSDSMQLLRAISMDQVNCIGPLSSALLSCRHGFTFLRVCYWFN